MIEHKYERIELLGHGGFGDVWLVRNTLTNELAALKIMHIPKDVQSDLKARERFMREIEIARILDHPHLLPALESGYMLERGYNLPYLVSPYMPDGSLAKVIKETPPWEHWTLAQTADAIFQAAQGLEYMHTLAPSIIHQDVKPGNFLIRWEHERGPDRIVHLFLNDFGISRWQRKSSDLTSQIVGTPGYLAPEQLSGVISWTADLYALAAMSHLLLTGELPQPDPNNDATFLSPSALNPQRVPSKEIDNVILKALGIYPKLRQSSVLEFARELRNAMLQTVSPYDERTEVSAGARLDDPTRQKEPAQPPVDEVLPPIDLDSMAQNKNQGQYKAPPPIPPEAHKSASQPLAQQAFRELLRKELPARPTTLCWSGDGNAVVCTFWNEVPRIIARDGTQEILRVPGTVGSVRAVGCVPGGRLLAVVAQTRIKQSGKQQSSISLWNMDTPAETAVTLLVKNSVIEALDWSKKRQLAIWVESQILVFTVPKNVSALSHQSLVPEILSRPDMYSAGTGVLRWSPDGSLLAVGTRNGAIMLWRATATTPTFHWQVPASNQLIYNLAWSPDNTLLAVAYSNRRVAVWNVRKGEILVEWKRLPMVPLVLSISSEQRLVVASESGELFLGNIDDPAPTATHAGHRLAAWSPTRSELVTLDAQKETDLIIWGI